MPGAGFGPPGRPRVPGRGMQLPEIPGVGPTLEHLVGSHTRARVLACLFADPSRPLWLRQIMREVRMGASNVQRELRWLTGIGLVGVQRLGGAHLYVIDEEHPLCGPLKALLAAAQQVDEYGPVPVTDAATWFR